MQTTESGASFSLIVERVLSLGGVYHGLPERERERDREREREIKINQQDARKHQRKFACFRSV